MARPDSVGFSIMDVSTAILDDEKFQRLAVHAPDRYPNAVVGFLATLSRSWRKGYRVSVVDAWPVYRPFDQLAVDALVGVGLLDARGRISARSWHEWFDEARIRRDSTRERWRKDKANERERLRGVRADSAQGPLRPSVPTVPTESPRPRARGGGARGGPKSLRDAALASGGFVAAVAAGGKT